jgi:flavin reductase (DIM6/NTAB) family NADH-FMN oxidoreductase RutF
VLWAFPSGLYLLSSRAGEERNLMAISFVTQLATDPKLVGVGVERDAKTASLVASGRAFGLVVLSRTQRAEIRHFVKPAVHDPDARTLAGVGYVDSPVTGVPRPELAGAFLDCRVTAEHDLGSHRLFVGEVVDVVLSDEHVLAEPLRMEDTRMSYGG